MLAKFLYSHKFPLQIVGKVLVVVVKFLSVYSFTCLFICLFVCLLCLVLLLMHFNVFVMILHVCEIPAFALIPLLTSIYSIRLNRRAFEAAPYENGLK